MKTLFSVNLIAFSIMLHGNALAINAKTNIGPALTGYRSTGDRHVIHLFFKGHISDHIWEAVYDSSTREWTNRGRISDRSGSNWALTCAEPAADSHGSIYFRGHNNFRIGHYVRSKRSGESEGAWEFRGYLSFTPSGLRTEISYTPFSPSVMLWDWDSGIPYIESRQPTVVFTKCDNKIYFQRHGETRFGIPSSWRGDIALPDDCTTNTAPTCCNIGGSFGVFYQARGIGLNGYQIRFSKKEDDDVSHNEWTNCSLPSAFTNKKIAVAYYEPRHGLLVAYKGHNNNHIWLLLYKDEYGDITEAGSWRRLGYIAGIETSESPALAKVGSGDRGTFYLAFKPVDDTEISVGILEIDESNRVDAAGHTYRSIRSDR